jgi:hypothetical protein
MISEAEEAKQKVLKIYPDAHEYRYYVAMDKLSEDVLITCYLNKSLEGRWQPNSERAWIDTWKRIQEKLIKKLEE